MKSRNYQETIDYHEATKHHLHRYARSPGFMDWENQPDPFRVYAGCPRVQLPLKQTDPSGSYENMYRRKQAPAPISLSSLGQFLALSMGLSAWKAVGGARWALRMNPSSGNLHPTEAHLILPETEKIPAGVYHYSPLLHSLEHRATMATGSNEMISDAFGCQGFLVGLTSIFWRESWKYGERAFRYCNHDVGHALAALSFSAALQGWRMACLHDLSDDQIEILLGLKSHAVEPEDAEHPDILCFVSQNAAPRIRTAPPHTFIQFFSNLHFTGTPNQLSNAHVKWDIIHRVDRATRKPTTTGQAPAEVPEDPGAWPTVENKTSAAEIIRKRRSAVNFDGKGMFPGDRFISLLSRTLPRSNCPPFDVAFFPAAVHFLLFVHRVENLTPGMYFFCRVPGQLAALRKATRPTFSWQPVREGFPLFLLSEKDTTHDAIEVSCHQDIAGRSCFSLGMIADFDQGLEEAPYRYRYLFWETGILGQILYLEAEAHGYRGTGIGCFFDDAVHDILGLGDTSFQSLYHFTIGVPAEDARLTTLPAYHHLGSG